jgi:excisionase family DNA binding protein
MTRQEVAEYLALPLSTLDYYVQTNQIPFSRLGKRNVRFSKDKIDAWFQSREGIEFRKNGNKNSNQ